MMIHWNTRNQSFIKMHFNLKQKGITNNTYFLTLLDPELEFVDPYDPNLTRIQKARILNEIINNYWYFLREVVRVQTPGGSKMYELNSAFLAFHYLSELNINIYIETARQIGKTTAVLVRKLYTYNFIYFDEHAFMKYNDVIYASVIPAYNTAANISREQNNPFGIVITTTAGSRNRDYAEYSYQFKENATKWDQSFYDLTPEQLYAEINKNTILS